MTPVVQLQAFLERRGAQAGPFFLGDWLSSLSEADFVNLRAAMDRFQQSGDQTAADELCRLVVGLMVAELAKPSLTFQDSEVLTWINALRLNLAIEKFRRSGWIVLMKPLSIQPTSKLQCQITPEGRRAGDRMRFH